MKTLTFVLYDAETDGVAVKEDGKVIWQESSFDRLDQFIRSYQAKHGNEPVLLTYEDCQCPDAECPAKHSRPYGD